MRQCSGAITERLTRSALASRCALRAARRCRRSIAARSSSISDPEPTDDPLLLGRLAGEFGTLPSPACPPGMAPSAH